MRVLLPLCRAEVLCGAVRCCVSESPVSGTLGDGHVVLNVLCGILGSDCFVPPYKHRRSVFGGPGCSWNWNCGGMPRQP